MTNIEIIKEQFNINEKNYFTKNAKKILKIIIFNSSKNFFFRLIKM
jgi:hypothetical protein